MSVENENTLNLCGEVCEIVQDGDSSVQIKILCKPDHLFIASHNSPDLHLGDKVFLTIRYETEQVLLFTTQLK